MEAPEGGSSHTRWPVFWDWKYGRRVSLWDAEARSSSGMFVLLLELELEESSISCFFLLDDLNLDNSPLLLPFPELVVPPPPPALRGNSQTAKASTHVSLSAAYSPTATRAERRAEKSSDGGEVVVQLLLLLLVGVVLVVALLMGDLALQLLVMLSDFFLKGTIVGWYCCYSLDVVDCNDHEYN